MPAPFERMMEMIGFWFNGKHSSDYNVWWIPERSGWIGMEDFENFTEEYSMSPGGRYFGSRAKIRTFLQKCFAEDINYFQRKEIFEWLKMGVVGNLIMDNRPCVSYNVFLASPFVITEYPGEVYDDDRINGTFTLSFTAVYPYGELLMDIADGDYGASPDEANVLPFEKNPPLPSSSDTSFLVYNPGDVSTPLKQRIKGSWDGNVTIRNTSNNSNCIMLDVTDAELMPSEYFVIDGANMTVTIYGGLNPRNGCEFHDNGYQTLEPNRILARNLEIRTTSGSNEITGSAGTFTDDMIGAYIYINGEWNKITDVIDMQNATIENECEETDVYMSMVATMNEITITPDGSLTFNALDIDFTPYVR